ncbi:mitochondrial transcription rescue factor 1 [Ornithorhynchus anatinus]|uniref:Mitochondrial transcription rescue factor 1 n=1 Tax=Ornithorhynchus anatinus TaxID=9258 RepID=F6RDJ6_ORNAN|nr:mitochondrial transcription rescue factor 1 [Ornithorhynchus anatinus]
MSSWRRLPVWTLGRFSAWIGPWGRHPPSRPWPSLSHGICSSSHQLNASTSRAPFPSLPRGSPLRPVAVSPLCPTLSSSRLKSNKSSRKARNRTLQQQEEEEDEDSPEEGDWSEQEDLLDNDPHVTRDYKDLDKVVPSLRYDAILKAGLDIARNKVEDAFYKGELRLNGEKLWKKSRTVKVGDTLDLLIGDGKDSESEIIMRVVLREVLEEKTETEKHRVVLRRWKHLKLPKKPTPQ